ncbi:MAG TPA: monovalent cation:proton antiporter-2 (CPA2) family protein [Moheibacter sp.]|nr:monovalent cation:proton antiporter-2 (CPA2) family protein [Moheibacter sp.]
MGEISLIQAFIYLLAAVICVPIAKRLGLGSVLGYLLAGILIGPFVLGKILGTTSGDEVKDIMHAAEFGVVMMLFLVGLELDPKEFWRMRKKIVGIGSLQLFGTMAIVVPISLYFISPNWGTAIAIGSAVAMSSTAIILQTLSEKGLTKTPCGQASFSVLLFQDIMVIPILAILPLLAIQSTIISGNTQLTLLEGAPAWMKTLAIVSAIGLVFFVGNYIVTPFFKYIARLQVRELFTSFTLMLVIGVSILMSYVGLSPALGAFMAGMTLANSEFKHQLESDIEPFKALLLGLFFISVGSTINFRLIIEEPIHILFLTFGFLLIKAIVLLLAGWIFKLKLTQNILFALLLSQIGEFAFVILNLSFQLQLIPKQWIDLLFATTALTMAITPILLLVNEKWIIPMMGMQKVKSGGFEDDLNYDFGDLTDQKVIIAGYGDFGNTIGRILKYNGFNVTALDTNSKRVDLLRKLGFNVHFGDATQLNTLKAVKAGEADIIIAAMESSNENQLLVDLVKKHFPHLKLFIRAKNRFDAYHYLKQGEKRVYRESFFTSVQVGVDALEALGLDHEDAVRQGQIFAVADRSSLRKLSAHTENLEEYISVSKEELKQVNRKLKEGLDLEHYDQNDKLKKK